MSSILENGCSVKECTRIVQSKSIRHRACIYKCTYTLDKFTSEVKLFRTKVCLLTPNPFLQLLNATVDNVLLLRNCWVSNSHMGSLTSDLHFSALSLPNSFQSALSLPTSSFRSAHSLDLFWIPRNHACTTLQY